MEYKKGFKIKPHISEPNGDVLFTDGTNNDIIPNQAACEAYGYKYDRDTGTCKIYNYVNLDKAFGDLTNKKHGELNETGSDTHNTMLIGRNNKTFGNNENCLVTGENNIIDNDTKEATITGSYGKATRTGEFVIGGGSFNTLTGGLQTSIYHLSNDTTGGDVSLYCNYNTTDHEEILLPKNSICIYEIYITGLCVGGSSGTAGHFQARKLYGSLLCYNNGAIDHDAHSNEDITTSGTTGTVAIATATAYTFSVQVNSTANVSVQWNAAVKLYINQTNRVSLSP